MGTDAYETADSLVLEPISRGRASSCRIHTARSDFTVHSLGSAAAFGNIIAGVILTYMRPFVIGDRVKIADTIGDVMEKTLLVTRVHTIKNVDVTIPNTMVLGSHLVNFSACVRNQGVILHTSVAIGYTAPWQIVHELLSDAARMTAHILPKPEPFVLQTSLNDLYVTYELSASTDQPNRMATIYTVCIRTFRTSSMRPVSKSCRRYVQKPGNL